MALAVMPSLGAQPKKAFQGQSPSTITSTVKDGEQTIEITNVQYEVAGPAIPGRPLDELLVLRKSCRTKQFVDEIGMEASITVQAWPLNVDLAQNPLYALTVDGAEPRTINHDVLVILRGVEEVEWWSVYKLGSGAHLFDTYVPLVQLSIGWPEQEPRYVGLEVPPDDVSDTRLKQPKVAFVLTYASAERVIREALVTSDEPERAQVMRSLADATRTVVVVDHPQPAAPGNKYRPPAHSVKITVQSYVSPPVSVTIDVPIAHDDLDVAHATVPAGVHVAAWKR